MNGLPTQANSATWKPPASRLVGLSVPLKMSGLALKVALMPAALSIGIMTVIVCSRSGLFAVVSILKDSGLPPFA